MERAKGKCERCHQAKPLQFHHLKKRSQGGKHELSNAAALCLDCHEDVENHPLQARAEGFSL